MGESLVRHTGIRLVAQRHGSIMPVDWRLLAIGTALCAAGALVAASLLGIPTEPHFDGSLLAGNGPVWSIMAAAIVFAISMLVGVVSLLLISDEAGLFCACLGLGALAIRCGSMRSVLQYASGAGVFAVLAVESVILFAFVIGGWFGFRFLLGMLRGESIGDPVPGAPNEMLDAGIDQKLATLGVQVFVMAACVLLMVQTDSRPQALAGMGIAAFIGSVAAYLFTPLPESFWYWAGPTAVALLGYVLAMFNPSGLVIGEPRGWAAALARLTPLDYATVGTAMALLGHWCSRRWAQPEEESEDESPPAEAAPSPST